MTAQVLHVQEAGTGLPVVLLHAFPLSSDMWSDQREELGGTARVITLDLRGFGRSAQNGVEPSVDVMAADVIATLDRLELDRVVLGGLSMGGYVAMAFCRLHPERLRGLLLADTKAGEDPPAARERRLAVAARLEREGTAKVLIEEVLPALCGPTTTRERPEVVRRVRAMVEAAPPSAAAWAQRAMAARPGSLDALREVGIPALVLRGDEDGLATQQDADDMVTALPDARLAVLHGAGHLSALEVPQQFAVRVEEFLRELD